MATRTRTRRAPLGFLSRLRSDEGGFGLVELVIALTVLNIGLLALVAAMNSGAVALQRASRLSTAAALADAQMELYRAIRYDAIALDTAAVSTANGDTRYTSDAAWNATQVTAACTTPLPKECNPRQTVNGPDGRSYRIDSYIVTDTPPGAGPARTVKLVTVVVRDGSNTARTFVRQESTFDVSTGG